MNTVIHRVDSSLTSDQVLDLFKSELEKREEQYESKSEIEKLVDTYAKTPTDNFIVTDKNDLKYMINQGDIVIQSSHTDYFKAVKDTIMDRRPARDMNLQEGVSVTGDHRIIPLEGANITIEDARFVPLNGIVGRRPYECKIVKSDKPFLIAHREHGNIALPADEYLVYSQIDAKTQRRVYD